MKSMKFKCGKDIPVGTLVYKKVYEPIYNDGWVSKGVGRVITCVVTKPGFCPNIKEDAGKCRVGEVLVIGVSGKTSVTTFVSGWDTNFKYTLYKKARTKLDTNKNTVCTEGIHVFLTKSAATRW